MDLGAENLDREMDLVSFIRRTRMHSYALQFLTNHRDRVLSGILGYSKYLRSHDVIKQQEEESPCDFADVYDWWNKDENLCHQEKFLVALIKRYRKNLDKNETNKVFAKDNFDIKSSLKVLSEVKSGMPLHLSEIRSSSPVRLSDTVRSERMG